MVTVSRPISIHLIVPNEVTRFGLEWLFEHDDRFRVLEPTGPDAPASFDSLRPDLILLDTSRSGARALQIIDELRRRVPDSAIALLGDRYQPELLAALLEKRFHGYFLHDFAANSQRFLEALIPVARSRVVTIGPAIADGNQSYAGIAIRAHASVETSSNPTEREREVLALAAEGLDDQRIADRLHVQLRTVEYHFAQSRERLGATNRFHLACLAKDLGLI